MPERDGPSLNYRVRLNYFCSALSINLERAHCSTHLGINNSWKFDKRSGKNAIARPETEENVARELIEIKYGKQIEPDGEREREGERNGR